MNLKIIGTNHLMSEDTIEKLIKDENPDVLGVELCETRFKALTNQLKQTKEKDDSLIGEITDSIKQKADDQNLDYGSDMKTVMFYSINNNIPLILADKDMIEIRKDMEKIPEEEQIYLQQELVKFQQENLNSKVDESEVLDKMKNDIPITYKILVEDRNDYIANKIKQETKKYPGKRILVFLGSGHVKEINKLLEAEQWN